MSCEWKWLKVMGIYRKIPNGYKRLVQRLDSRFRFHGIAGPVHPDRSRFRFRFHGTVGPVHQDRSWFRFHGTVGLVHPNRFRFQPAVLRSGSCSFFSAVSRFRQLFFRRFHGSTIRAGSKPVANCFGSGTVLSGSAPVRFRVTHSVAITNSDL